MNKISQIKIPTLLAIFLISLFITSGFFFTGNSRSRFDNSPALPPKDVRISNISESSFTVSWTTDTQTQSSLVWGKEGKLTNTLEVSKENSFTHWITINGLNPLTGYSFKIINGNSRYDNRGIPWHVTTGGDLATRSRNMVFGKVATANNLVLKDVLVYVTVTGSSLLSTTTNKTGSFEVDISQARRSDLTVWQEVNKDSQLEFYVNAGPFGIASVVSYPTTSKPLPVIVIGESRSHKNVYPFSDTYLPSSQILLPGNLILHPGINNY
jgi:hypothetical protein